MQASLIERQESGAWAILASLRLAINPQDVLDRFGGPVPLLQQSAEALKGQLPWTSAQVERLAAAQPLEDMLFSLERLERQGITLIPYPHPDYPPLLKQISCPPAALWCRGHAGVLRRSHVAIVGARQASPYGLRVASSLARGLAEAGVGVVSGGAYGIDAAAHEGALGARGASIAVFGTGISRDYPASHRPLFVRLAEHGACISEFGPDASPRPEHFPIRNRLISGLSLGVVVVEAGDKSGALITARFALEQNREVFAVPGEIFSDTSIGSNRLIQSGARLVSSVSDILEELRGRLEVIASPRDGSLPALSLPLPADLPAEATTVLACLDRAPRSLEAVILESSQGPAKVLEVLMELELAGLVSQLPGQRYVRRM